MVSLWNEILKTAKNAFTITFSNNSKIVEGELENNISKYGNKIIIIICFSRGWWYKYYWWF